MGLTGEGALECEWCKNRGNYIGRREGVLKERGQMFG